LPGLDFDAFRRDFDGAMKRWSARRFIAVLLSVFLTVGLSLSAARADEATMRMAMASNSGASIHGDCHTCPSDADGNAKAMACGIVCATPILSAVPQVISIGTVQVRPLVAPPEPLLTGRASSPDPYPPRPFHKQ
jgi:hypothetical protein